MAPDGSALPVFPTPLTAFPPPSPDGVLATLAQRAAQDPFTLVATGIFVLAIVHTFGAARFLALAHRVQHGHDEKAARAGRPAQASVLAEFLHFMGEVEVVFGLWVIPLGVAIALSRSWGTARIYLGHTVDYTEAVFVVVIMALAATRPVVSLAESALRRIANVASATPAAWWLTILTVGPLLGSFITEPAAMTICAMLLGRQFFELGPAPRLKYATLGLLFVNVSIGGTLTHFAAPPVLIAALASVVANTAYFVAFRKQFAALTRVEPASGAAAGGPAPAPVPAWVTVVNVGFMALTVMTSHEPALFIGAFLFFLGFAQATAPFQSDIDLKPPLLVGFFLGGLVIHGGLQGWWIQPVLASLSEHPLFFGSTFLTAFNDNALITYLSTLVPGLNDSLKIAIVGGAVTGGGLTVIANAPNPAGRALLGRFFERGITPTGLLIGAIPATAVAAVVFRLL